MSGPVAITADDMVGAGPLLRMVDVLAEAFRDLSGGLSSSPSRTCLEHGPDRQLLVSPAVWERRGVASVKVTSITPGNDARGLPLIHGVVVLTDLATGQITALLDGAALTAVRTAAVAALATRLCAPQDAAALAVIGAGVQARALVEAMTAVRPIRSVRVHSRTDSRTRDFAQWARSLPGAPLQVTVCDTVQDAVAGAQIVCTATSTDSPTPLVAADWVAAGAHLNVIGGTTEDAVEVDPALLATSLVVVEDRAAAIEDAGEIRQALASGLVEPVDLHPLGELVDGTVRGGDRISVFRGVGLALEDTAAAVALYEAVTLTSRHGSAP